MENNTKVLDMRNSDQSSTLGNSCNSVWRKIWKDRLKAEVSGEAVPAALAGNEKDQIEVNWCSPKIWVLSQISEDGNDGGMQDII